MHLTILTSSSKSSGKMDPPFTSLGPKVTGYSHDEGRIKLPGSFNESEWKLSGVSIDYASSPLYPLAMLKPLYSTKMKWNPTVDINI